MALSRQWITEADPPSLRPGAQEDPPRNTRPGPLPGAAAQPRCFPSVLGHACHFGTFLPWRRAGKSQTGREVPKLAENGVRGCPVREDCPKRQGNARAKVPQTEACPKVEQMSPGIQSHTDVAAAAAKDRNRRPASSSARQRARMNERTRRSHTHTAAEERRRRPASGPSSPHTTRNDRISPANVPGQAAGKP